jgi:hypothetical protein
MPLVLTPSIPPERVEEVLGKEIDLNALREFLKYNNNGEYVCDSSVSFVYASRGRAVFLCSRAPPLNEEAVLKINVTLQGPDWTIPWQRLDVEFARGKSTFGRTLSVRLLIRFWCCNRGRFRVDCCSRRSQLYLH